MYYWVGLSTLIILALGRLGEKDPKLRGQPGLYNETIKTGKGGDTFLNGVLFKA